MSLILQVTQIGPAIEALNLLPDDYVSEGTFIVEFCDVLLCANPRLSSMSYNFEDRTWYVIGSQPVGPVRH